MKSDGYILVYVMLLTPLLSPAQSPINILSVQQGLPKSQINHIAQDSFDFLWLGTRDGLLKFDGSEITVFNKKNQNLPFDYCNRLFFDSQHRLWIPSNADYKGVAAFNIHDHSYTLFDQAHFPSLSSNGIVDVAEDIDGEMAFITKDFHLNIWHRQDSSFSTYDLSAFLPDKRSVVNVNSILADPVRKSHYWLATIEGLFLFDVQQKKYIDIVFFDGWNPVRFHDSGDGYLWVTLSSKGGLIKIDLHHLEEKHYFGLDTSFQFSHHLTTDEFPILEVIALAKKSEEEFFVSTVNKGIGTFHRKTGKFDFSQHKNQLLEDDFVRSVFSNDRGEFWAGTDKYGLFYLKPESKYLHIQRFESSAPDHTQINMRDIFPLGNNRYALTFFKHPEIWIWNRTKDSFGKISFENSFRYGYNIIQNGNQLLVGTNRQFYELDTLNHKLIPNAVPLSNDIRNINNILLTQHGFWFVAWGYGIMHYSKGNIVDIPGGNPEGLKHRWTHDLTLGPDQHLWIGQQNGLYKLDTVSNEITCLAHEDQLNGFTNANFKAIVFDHLDRLWIGNFGGGIACYDISGDTVLFHINVQNGLPSDRVYDLEIDEEGYIWIWTAEGLGSFYPESDVSRISLQYYPETKFIPVNRDGIFFDKIDNNEIFFGIAGGYAHFHPTQLRQAKPSTIRQPFINGYRVFNEDQPLTLGQTSQINLAPNENFISIAYSAPESGFRSNQRFQHKLIGVDDGWVNNGKNKIASYTDLDPGIYEFQVRVGDQDGNWSEVSRSLHLKVAAPWYARLWALVLWSLIGIVTTYGIFRMLLLRERMKSKLTIAEIERQNLKELDQAKSHFFTQISHEFRTPLTVVLGMVKQLLKKYKKDHETKRQLEAIDRNGTILLKQINQILDLSKLKSQYVQLNLVYADIVLFLKYLLEPFQTYALSKNIVIHFDSTHPSMIMDYDPEGMQTIINNLLSNAIKYSNADTQIDVQVKKNDNNFLLVSVKDQGPGILEEDLHQIFDPFFQSANQVDKLGSGLGLATSYQWAQAMGGDLIVSSQDGKGSCFTLSLPITESAQVPSEKGLSFRKNHPEIVKSELGDQALILLIEDNRDVVDYIKLCLSDYRIIEANNGASGIELAIDKVPDLIITDIMLPLKDGYEVCSIVRANPVSSHIPIIMLTAKATAAERKAGLSLGADAYLTKPFDQEELLIRIENLLSQRKLLQQKYSNSIKLAGKTPTLPDHEESFLDAIQRFVHQHIEKDITVEELANTMSMSRVQLYRKVKALTDMSVSKYISLIRLYEARKRLRKTQITVSQVAYDVGFSDPSYFSKLFKEAFGHSPSDVKAADFRT